ncbi:probable salivary secreted peptide [Halyomorpha halys]|uniref:probable salivary secreted peptide n=1 Tax=Halyomorpha halys TaxID=286706 RepID=UPI0006D51925|nr:probable salivary secreted peptide [Halyomorpha halys]
MKGIYHALLLAVAAAILLQLVSVEAAVTDSDCGHGNKTHHYFYGSKSYLDRLLYQDHIKYKSKWMRVISIDADYPGSGKTPLGKINYIEVLDQRSDGTGGCVYIRNGGVGQNSVTFHIKSQRNHGMEFLINIYGH